MHTFRQGLGNGLVRKLGLARGFDDMTFLGAIDLFRRFVRNAVDVGMTVLTFVATMGTTFEQFVINIKEAKFAGLIDTAQASMFMANETIELIGAFYGQADTRKDEAQQDEKQDTPYSNRVRLGLLRVETITVMVLC